jgi:hypothetical protein
MKNRIIIFIMIFLVTSSFISVADFRFEDERHFNLTFIQGELHATLATNSGPPIHDFELRRMLDRYVPSDNAHSSLLVFTQCYGGDMMDDFKDREGTTVLSATKVCQTAVYGGYDDDAAKALRPGQSSESIHDFGSAGCDPSENPQSQGPGCDIEPINPLSDIGSRHVVVYAGQPDPAQGRDFDQREDIRWNFQDEISDGVTTVTTVGGDGTGGWDYPGTMEGLRQALEEVGKRMGSDEQFILFVTDHGGKTKYKKDQTITPDFSDNYINTPFEIADDFNNDNNNQPTITFITQGPNEIIFDAIRVNGVWFLDYELYELDYDNNDLIDENEGLEYIFPIYEEIIIEGENHIEMWFLNEDPVTLKYMGINYGFISKLSVEESNPPELEIIKPKEGYLYLFNNEIFPIGNTIIISSLEIEVDANDDESGMDRVEFYIDDNLRDTDWHRLEGYTWFWDESIIGRHTIGIIAYDNNENSIEEHIEVWIFNI